MLYEVITTSPKRRNRSGNRGGRTRGEAAIRRSVITSYSIHYTKLYDARMKYRAGTLFFPRQQENPPTSSARSVVSGKANRMDAGSGGVKFNWQSSRRLHIILRTSGHHNRVARPVANRRRGRGDFSGNPGKTEGWKNHEHTVVREKFHVGQVHRPHHSHLGLRRQKGVRKA